MFGAAGGGGGGQRNEFVKLQHGFRASRDGVLSQFAGQNEACSGLDLTRGERGDLGVAAETTGFAAEALEEVIDKTRREMSERNTTR